MGEYIPLVSHCLSHHVPEQSAPHGWHKEHCDRLHASESCCKESHYGLQTFIEHKPDSDCYKTKLCVRIGKVKERNPWKREGSPSVTVDVCC